jgi:hypothetical protein
MDRQSRALENYGPWQGVQMHAGLTTPGHLENGFNLDVGSNEISTRPGRLPYTSGNQSIGAILGLRAWPVTRPNCIAGTLLRT